MSDQITANLNLAADSTGFTDNKNWDFTDLLATQGLASGMQTATTAYAAITIGDLPSSDAGVLVLKNLDTNNYCLYGSTNGEFKLDPGEFAFMRINPGKTIQIIANTANVKFEKYLLGK